MESRVKRYSRRNRLKRRIKRNIKALPKNIVMSIIYVLVALLYIIYILVKGFNNLIAKLFMKIPRLIRVALIYTMVINTITNIILVSSNHNIELINPLSLEVIHLNSEQVNFNVEGEKTQECKFDSTSCLIYNKAKELGLNEDQTLMSIAISKWETGNYTSVAFRSKNNVGGMMCSSGLITYNSLEEGIIAFLSNLKYNYFDIGLDTLEKIQPKYCPIGAENDPNNLNVNWLGGAKKMYNELKSK